MNLVMPSCTRSGMAAIGVAVLIIAEAVDMELRARDPRQDAPLPDSEEPRQIAHRVGRENGAGQGRHAERRAPAHGVRKPEGKDKRGIRLGKKTPVDADLISADEDRKGTIEPHSKELLPPAQFMRRPYQPERAAVGPARPAPNGDHVTP